MSRASVTVSGSASGAIDRGLLVRLGVARGDDEADAQWMADKVTGLRIFEDAEGKMNRSVADVGGGVLAVSQFTLLGDCRKGRRPSFVGAAEPERAAELYEAFVAAVRSRGIPAETGRFREHMDVSLVNDGPVTLVIESPNRPRDGTDPSSTS